MASVPFFLIIGWNLPEIAIIGLLGSIFGVFPDFLLPSIPLAGGTFRPEDIGMPALLLLLTVKHIGNINNKLNLFKPYWAPLGIFLSIAVISAISSILFKTAPFKDVLNEARPYTTWLLLPILALSIYDESRYKRFIYYLFFLALILAAGSMFQSLTGYQIFSRGQELRQLWSTNGSVEGVLRSTTPGMFLMTGALMYILAAFASRQVRHPFILLLCTTVLAGGTFVGFGRGIWLSIVVGICILYFYSSTALYLRTLLIIGLAAFLTTSVFLITKPDYVFAVADRFLSVADEVEHGTSFGRRNEENRYALGKIIESPIRGVGLGGRYMPETTESIAWPEQARYVHNAYTKVAVKTGLPGLLSALYLVITILIRSRRCATNPVEHSDIAFAAYWVLLTTLIFTSLTQPNFVAPNGVASVCVALLFVEHLYSRMAQNTKQRPRNSLPRTQSKI